MKKSLPVFLFLITISLHSFSQLHINIEWASCYGGTGTDGAYCIQPTSDGGFIVAGESNSSYGGVWGNHGNYDFWVVRLTGNGDTIWTRSLGGSSTDKAYSIQETTDGGFIVAGASSSTGSVNNDVSGNHGGYDFWVVKLDPDGNINWEQSYGGTGNDYAYSAQQTLDGGYIVVGSIGSSSNSGNVTFNHGGTDCWVVKLSPTGDIQFQKSLGGTGDDYGYSIQQTADSGYIIAGQSTSNDGNVTGNHGFNDAWVVRIGSLSDSLAIQWEVSLGGSGYDYAQAVDTTNDGGYIVAGYTNSTDGDVNGNHGLYDYWVIKLNAAGDTMWTKCYGGSGTDEAFSIRQTADSGYICLGESNSLDGQIALNQDGLQNHGGYDYWAIKLDQSGNLSWEGAFGGSGDDYGYSILETKTDIGYIMAGWSASTDGQVSGNRGGDDFWVVKLGSLYDISEKNNPISEFQISPNPVSQSAFISFSLLQAEDAVVKIYDVTGREIKTLAHSNLSAGIYHLKWDADNDAGNGVDNGVFLVSIETPDGTLTKRVAVIK